jgi:hypothetical protein
MAALIGARGSAVTGLSVHTGPPRSGPIHPGWLPVLAPSLYNLGHRMRTKASGAPLVTHLPYRRTTR